MSDVYHSPEKYDLEKVLEIDYSDGCYCFDYRVIWRHTPTGDLYTARDSGCSCPSPFEDYHSLGSLDLLVKKDIEEEIREQVEGGRYRGEDTHAFLRSMNKL